jgi:hypothetical protein
VKYKSITGEKPMKMLKGKKGLTPVVWIGVAIGIAFGVIMIAVTSLVLAALATSNNNTNFTTVVANGQSFLVNMTGQLGTVGTVAGVLLLVGLLVASGIGGFMLYNKYGR